MIAVASLQLRAGKSLAGKRASECTAGLLSLCAKWCQRCEQKYREQPVHSAVLEQTLRLVEPDSKTSAIALKIAALSNTCGYHTIHESRIAARLPEPVENQCFVVLPYQCGSAFRARSSSVLGHSVG